MVYCVHLIQSYAGAYETRNYWGGGGGGGAELVM